MRVARELRRHLETLGFPVPPDQSDHPMQDKMDFLLFGTALKAAGDPDWEVFIRRYGGPGVPIRGSG